MAKKQLPINLQNFCAFRILKLCLKKVLKCRPLCTSRHSLEEKRVSYLFFANTIGNRKLKAPFPHLQIISV